MWGPRSYEHDYLPQVRRPAGEDSAGSLAPECTAMPTYMKTLLIAFAVVLAMLAIAEVPASADQHFISGRVVNQTPGAEPPSGLQVVLTIFEEGTPIGQLTATTDADGAFRIRGHPSGSGAPLPSAASV